MEKTLTNYLFRPNGVRFFAAAGTTAFAQRWTPKEGDIVTFKHHGFLGASGKPKFPSLHRIRTDMSWDDVVHQFTEPKARPVGKSPLLLYIGRLQLIWI